MGFIPSSTTQTLSAYLTQQGRKYILKGTKEQFQVKYFSLHDSDVNYAIGANIVSSNYNNLPNGFVPDITGDISECIKSIAEGIRPNQNSYLIVTTTTATLIDNIIAPVQ
jgi:hypothetical protein